ncbi:Kef-type K+ transport system, predicted NAD-binding component (fragment) [uncultured Desulfobacterium sp.]|uniref:Kef-type K+ transport system, predicted NAD-binding component n=1 Tax=uncultured Desulfobacterium sp. TaxID=201089 RepID=A0A445MSN6_9BACT
MVIAGGGRIGSYVAQVLQILRVPFVVIEINFQQIDSLKEKGFPTVYGDAGQPIVLEAANVEGAKLLVITTPLAIIAKDIIVQSRKIKPQLNIVARTEGMEQMQTLRELGIENVIYPEFEGGLEITRQTLSLLNIPPAELIKFTDQVRHEFYAPLYEVNSHSTSFSLLQPARHLLELTWIALPENSPFIGRTIKDLAVRSKTGVSVVGIINNDRVLSNPDVDYCFTNGDKVAVMGDADQIENFREKIQPA